MGFRLRLTLSFLVVNSEAALPKVVLPILQSIRACLGTCPPSIIQHKKSVMKISCLKTSANTVSARSAAPLPRHVRVTASSGAGGMKNRVQDAVGVAALLAAGTVFSQVLTPPASMAGGDLALGAQVFNNNCAACHLGGGNSVVPARTLAKADITEGLGGFDEAKIIYQVQNGKNAMPAWADRLEEDEIEGVASYVFDCASNNKWGKSCG